MISTRWARALRFGVSTTSILVTLSAGGFAACAQEVVGAVGAANAGPTATAPNQGRRSLKPGDDVFFKDRIATGSKSSAQITFLDRSTLNVGENSEIVIDEFVFRPGAAGTMRARLNRGMMRYVGGDISHGGGASVQTPVVTIGIRGGIGLIGYVKDSAAIAAVPGVPSDFKGGTIVINTYGTMTVRNSISEMVIRRPGFAVFVNTSASTIATPVRLDASSIQALMKTIGSRDEQHGGASATARRKALVVTSTLGSTINVPVAISPSQTINGLDYTDTFNAGNAFARVRSQARQASQLQQQLNAATPAPIRPPPAITSPVVATPVMSPPVAPTPVTTPVAPAPVTTPVVTTPVTTPVAPTPVTTPVVPAPVTTPVVPAPVTTPVVPAPVTTPVAPTPVTTPVAPTPVTTPVAPAPVTTPVVPTSVTTPVATTPVTTPVAPTPVTTPVAATPVSTGGHDNGKGNSYTNNGHGNAGQKSND